MSQIIIPADIAAYLDKAAKILTEHHRRLNLLLTLYADEGPADDWEISMEHNEAEIMAANLKMFADFAKFLSEVAGGQNDG